MDSHCNGIDERALGAAFRWAISLNAGYVLVEAGFGFATGSLALLSDAAHNLTDVFGLFVARGASVLARRKPSTRHTYGLGRGTILAALSNAIALMVAVGAIVWEAVGRFTAPVDIPAEIVL